LANTLLLKTVFLGDATVGKTTLLRTFLGEKIYTEYQATVGADISVKNFRLSSGELLTFQFWDLSGQDAFASVRKAFYARAHGAVLVYDVTKRTSFFNLQKWVVELKGVVGKIPAVIVGNKIDLVNQIQVTADEGQDFSKWLTKEMGRKIPFIETSALKNWYCVEVIENLGKLVLDTGFLQSINPQKQEE
jgi:Ras-related protein Rab-11A